MKITIEAEPKEIADLVKELEAQKTVVSKIKMDGDSIKSVVADLQGSSEIKTEASGIRAKISDDTINEIGKRFKELSADLAETVLLMKKTPEGQRGIKITECNGMDIKKINEELGKIIMAGAGRGAE